MIHFTRFFAALGLFLIAQGAMACAGIQGTHECGADIEIDPPAFENCVLIKAPGAQIGEVEFYLPSGNRVWVCPVDRPEPSGVSKTTGIVNAHPQ